MGDARRRLSGSRSTRHATGHSSPADSAWSRGFGAFALCARAARGCETTPMVSRRPRLSLVRRRTQSPAALVSLGRNRRSRLRRAEADRRQPGATDSPNGRLTWRKRVAQVARRTERTDAVASRRGGRDLRSIRPGARLPIFAAWIFAALRTVFSSKLADEGAR